MWRMYVAAVEAIGATVGPYGAQWILDPRKARRAVAASFAAFLIGITPLVSPAQLGSQSVERTLIQHDARIRAIERNQAEMVSTITRLTEQSNKIDRISEQVAVLANQISERDKFLAWILAMINTVALIAAGIAWMIRHRKQPH